VPERGIPFVAAAVPGAVVAALWLRLEEPRQEGEAALVVALALAPVLVRPWWGRLAASVAAALAAVWIAFSAPPWDLILFRGDWWDRVGTRTDTGLRDFNDVFVPFDSVERWELHGLVLLVIFVFVLGIAFSAAAGRPLVGVAVVLLGAGVPTTLLEQRVGIPAGAVVLASCLWLVAVCRARLGRGNLGAVVVGAAVVVVAAAAAGTGRPPSHAAVDWKNWNLYARSPGQVGLGYVWEANYDGIRFPPKPTTVLRVRGTDRASYWRASTLDAFDGVRWKEYLYAVGVRPPRGRLPADPLLPRRAYDERQWVRQQVEIAALRSNRLPASATPIALDSSSFAQVSYLGGGVIAYGAGLAPGQRYTVWSYSPRPSVDELRRSRPRYPLYVDRYLTLSGAQLPHYGTRGHDATVESRISSPYHVDLTPYRAVWEQARRVTASTSNPYDATLALERWFRSAGGFSYEEEPPRPHGLPPLVDFVLRTKQGYCQHFAGSMALMLRLLGVPARVAVGFTSGSRRDGVWTVTDYQAHAWVEAWFDGWGWLPFDPTPGRGAFSQTYTVASNSADAVLRLGGRPFIQQGTTPARPSEIGGQNGEGTGGSLWPALLLAGSAAVVGSLGLVKWLRRRWRYRTGGPRAIASAARAELADRLTDQGVRLPVPATLADVTRGLRSIGLNGTSFAGAAARARFGPPPLASRAAEDTRRELRSLVRAFRTSLPLQRRVRGFLSLRSLRQP
jgi:hypothetical protein